MASKKEKYIIGIDEVGRGALAGNVVVAATAVPTKLRIKNSELRIKKKTKNSKSLILNFKLAKLRDSKKLTSSQREIWFKYAKKELRLQYAIASVSPKAIDKINISEAANLAARKAFTLLIKNSEFRIKNCKVCLDGGLYLKSLKLKTWNLKSRTIIKGDEKISAISLASIIAKVSRDRQMKNLHKKYSQYGFEKNKGYGTKEHIKMIKKHGSSKIHRLTFLKKIR